MEPIVNIAIEAARKAGQIILRAVDRLDLVKVQEKGHNNFVTNVDQHAEAIIVDTIKKSYPSHSILAEESGYQEGSEKEDCWIIDPIDGTTNFMHGFPHFAVSIGIRYQDKIEHGVIYDPVRDEIFSATRGRGARLNNKRIRVTREHQIEKCLIGTGFPNRDHDPKLNFFLSSFATIYPKAAGLRRAGSAALDLAYVACGRLDGYWELGLSPWDMAAGSLIIREAGGLVSDFQGESQFLESGQIVAGSPKIYAALLTILQGIDTI